MASAWPLSIRVRLTLWYSGVLLAILIIVGATTYSLLRRSVAQDIDASLRAVATVIRDTGLPPADVGTRPGDLTIHDILGAELEDKLYQVIDPQGRLGLRSRLLGPQPLPLSARARAAATRGHTTLETVDVRGERMRLFTMPVLRDGELVHLVQVGIGLRRAERVLDRYLETLLVLVPVGLLLAAAGGALIARRALRPVDAMSRTARRISGEDLSERLPLRGTGDELDRLAGTLNAMLSRLDAAFSEVRRFAADAAHELRTPLTVIKGELEVALRAPRSPAEYQRVLASGLEEVERLGRLAEDLLLLSRFSAGVRDASASVELDALVVDVLDVGARLAKGHGVSVHLREVTPATVVGDAVALRRAVLNLVENAVKYTPAEGRVAVALVRDGTHASLSIHDTGIGIAPDDAERIFQPFVRLDPARARDAGGSGLGLAIARSIVLAHGGDLTLDSAPDQGSTFTIRLPLA